MAVTDTGSLPFSPAHIAAPELEEFAIEGYLAQEHAKDLLRFSTAGSVDDGKSTLIGRLLYDTQSVYDDQVRSIEGKGTTAPGVLDLALLTDGLRAEREQGITIDVAYRYFSTARRKFIIADTPGHEQYTRNMATGASTADVAIVLVDARKGVLKQSRRHAHITHLLGVRNLIVAVNKMDLVAYSQETFAQIEAQFQSFFQAATRDSPQVATLHFLPVSALAGDNIVQRSKNTAWYTGPTLLHLLETLPAAHDTRDQPFRFAVQRIARPNLDFRGYAGQVAAGSIHVGDTLLALPSLQTSRVARIVTFDGDLKEAVAPLSITLTLEDEIDISRGDLLTSMTDAATVATRIEISLLWMDAIPLSLGKRYLLKHASRTVYATIQTVVRKVDLGEGESSQAHNLDNATTLAMNEIAVVQMETVQPLYVDRYAANRHCGSLILIDPETHATVAAGMVRDISANALAASPLPTADEVDESERIVRWGHCGVVLTVQGQLAVTLAARIERTLFQQGCAVLRFDAREAALPAACAGAIAVVTSSTEGKHTIHIELAGRNTPEPLKAVVHRDLPPQLDEAVALSVTTLREAGALL
jgi:sulfate adenylyltransferase subunit 1